MDDAFTPLPRLPASEAQQPPTPPSMPPHPPTLAIPTDITSSQQQRHASNGGGRIRERRLSEYRENTVSGILSLPTPVKRPQLAPLSKASKRNEAAVKLQSLCRGVATRRRHLQVFLCLLFLLRPGKVMFVSSCCIYVSLVATPRFSMIFSALQLQHPVNKSWHRALPSSEPWQQHLLGEKPSLIQHFLHPKPA